MSSTTTAGTFSAPVGNTAYGRTAGVATAPSQVRAYAAARYVPPDQVDADPELISDVKVYPEAARREGIEGSVLLALLIDPAGRVIDAQVLRSLGRGLDEAAMGAARQFRFKPAMRSGEAVSTRIQYSYTFVLN